MVVRLYSQTLIHTQTHPDADVHNPVPPHIHTLSTGVCDMGVVVVGGKWCRRLCAKHTGLTSAERRRGSIFDCSAGGGIFFTHNRVIPLLASVALLLNHGASANRALILAFDTIILQRQ